MKTLIVEDDFTSRLVLQGILKSYGTVDTAVTGNEAVHAVKKAVDANAPFDLVCLDIMLPEMDGHETLQAIRVIEERRGVRSSEGTKVVMTTSLADPKNVLAAYNRLCDGYLVKPIDKAKLLSHLRKLKLIA